jgi:hypothetical protein
MGNGVYLAKTRLFTYPQQGNHVLPAAAGALAKLLKNPAFFPFRGFSIPFSGNVGQYLSFFHSQP